MFLVVERIIELGFCSALALGVILMSSLVVITIVHSLHETRRRAAPQSSPRSTGGEGWQGNDLVFRRVDGTSYRPVQGSRSPDRADRDQAA